MPVPVISHAQHAGRLPRLLLVLVLSVVCAPMFARGPEPTARIPLEALGFQAFPTQLLESGAALLTVHYVDDKHLLVTFNRHRLMARLPDDPPDDFDRNVDALLVELPSGRVLARASWRMHDVGQYLWSLGNGNFLLRVRNQLVTFAPLRGLPAGKAFEEHAFLNSRRPIGAVLLAPERNLLTLETVDRAPEEARRSPSPRTQAYNNAAAGGDEERPLKSRHPVQVNFIRVVASTETGLPVAQSAGALRAPGLALFPVDTAGYVSVLDQGHQHFAFDFHQHTGKVDELAPFDSTCQPAPFLVGPSEFIAFGCRSGDQLQMIGGFNLHGEEMWEQVLTEAYVSPSFAFAPSAGRFALGRVVTGVSAPTTSSGVLASSLGAAPPGTGGIGDAQSQTVSVYQMQTGRQILSLSSTPVLRAGGNFALADDGSELAIARNGAIEIYRLPALSSKDKAAVALAATYAPAPNTAPIRLNAHEVAEAESEPHPESDTEVPASAAASAGPVVGQEAKPVTVLGDPAPSEEGAPRKAPTLYGPADKGGAPGSATPAEPQINEPAPKGL